jgi:hypothetical protein
MEISNTIDQLFRYRKANDYSLDELENAYIYFPSNRDFNDPFDATHTMLRLTNEDTEMEKIYNQMLEGEKDDYMQAYIKKQYKNKPDELRKFINSETIKYISTYGIACFTVSPIHIVLWATYADNHEGICIQYDTLRDKSFFKGVRKMDYVEKLEVIDYRPFSNPEIMNDIFYKKLNLWEKEFEVRLIKPKNGIHKIDPECVRSIILGFKVKDDYIKKVIDIARRKYKHATLYRTEVMTESVGLSFIPLDL